MYEHDVDRLRLRPVESLLLSVNIQGNSGSDKTRISLRWLIRLNAVERRRSMFKKACDSEMVSVTK